MPQPFILASGSAIRKKLLQNAGLEFETITPRIDEDSVKDALIAEKASGRDIADTLAELKAKKISNKYPDFMVLGCDQVLSFENALLSKPQDLETAVQQLKSMRGRSHNLLSAAVIYENGSAVWRHVGTARMTMRQMSDAYIESYVLRNWESIRHSVGAYKIEEEGVRLFSQVRGDYFTVLGLPLFEILSYLNLMEDSET